jgi:hypothetical protein
MAYNVFKRPMFKRGGSTTGTGIMSHVEPKRVERIKAADGYNFTQTPAYKAASGFTNYGINSAIAGGLDLINVPLNTLSRFFTGYNPGFSGTKQMDLLTGGQFSKQTGYDPEKAYFFGPTSAKTGFSEAVKPTAVDDFEVSGETAQMLPGESAMDAVMRQGMERAAKRAAAKEDGPGLKEDVKYTESDKRADIEKEADLIKDLLKDEGLEKAELAFLVADALKTPGSIADKLDTARTKGMTIAAGKKKRDREATLLAYKGATEKELAKIKAEIPTGTQKAVQDYAKLKQKVAKGTATDMDKQVLEAYETGVFKGEDDATVKALAIQFAKNPEVLTDLESDIRKLSAKKDRSEREEEKLKVAIQNYTRIQNIIKAGGLGEYFNFKEGGRVMKQMGGDVTDEIKTESELELGVKETSGESNMFPTKTVEKLSFQELRDRLPQEITNDIVQLLSNSQEALQEFAYIRSQQDINDFNLKYGVNLILPPEKA